MRIKQLLLLCLLIVGSKETVDAQNYRNAVGIRGGYSSGFTFKHNIHRHYAVDVQAIYNKDGFQLNGLYEYHFSPYDRKRLYYYAGAGPYAGNFNDKFAVGAAAALGAEFILRSAPVSFGVEWKPFINAFREFNFSPQDVGIHVRLMFR
jgi:hypothetical protein